MIWYKPYFYHNFLEISGKKSRYILQLWAQKLFWFDLGFKDSFLYCEFKKLEFKSSFFTFGSKFRGSKIHFWLGVQIFIFDLGFKSYGFKNAGFKNSSSTRGSKMQGSKLTGSKMQSSKVWGSKIPFSPRVQISGFKVESSIILGSNIHESS